MEIESGLFDNMVIQINSKGLTDSNFSGKCSKDGKVYLTVRNQKGDIVKGFKDVCAGESKKGIFLGKIKGLKAGGPYKIEVYIKEKDGNVSQKKVIRNVCAGYVWVAAGQSNMQGCGLLKDAAKPHPMVRAFYMNDRWDVAKDPIHNLWQCVDDVHVDLGVERGERKNLITGTGPAVSFAQKMFELTGIPQGIIACAHGGTSMSQWDPPLKSLGGKSLYGATLRRIMKNGGKIAGIIWYQGESDANENNHSLYKERMKNLINSFRKDLNNKNLPFVAVQLGRYINAGMRSGYWNSIQYQQYEFLDEIKNYSVVSAIDLSLDDTIHISGRDQKRLGERIAYAMNVLIKGKTAGKPPIRVDRISVRPVKFYNFSEVVINFKNVAGKLFVPGNLRPSGFSIGDPEPRPAIYDAFVEGSKVILKTNLSTAALEGKIVYHGYGLDPYCNVIDTHDRVIPVFKKQIGKYRALTEMWTEWDVSYPVEIPESVDAKLDGLEIEHLEKIQWRPKKFSNFFCDLHEELQHLKGKDFLILFSRNFSVKEPMKLAACIGYDGPIKIFIDGKEIFHDPEGTNPAWEDKAKVKFDIMPEIHRIIIALGSNKCKAWGIYFRFERIDIPDEKLKETISVLLPEPV